MGRLVYAGATSHVGAIIKNPDAHPDRNDVLRSAWQTMAQDLAAADPDVVVVVATDHYETFGLEHYPIFCLGSAESYPAWGEYGNPGGTVLGSPSASDGLHHRLVAAGFDVARAMEMPLDHSFMVPILRLGLEQRAVVPFFVNCNTPPLPPLGRCRDLGRGLRAAIEGLPGETTVAVIATGGVSHWVGLPQFGQVNAVWDRHFLDTLQRGDLEEVLTWSDEQILEEAGNGALEIRTWVLAQACAGGPADLLGYAPMPDWAIGIGVVRMQVAA
ncbi:hypothetical protein RB608_01230 [Nocardioides sp. LHD-245]|uniref:DODA-type extradiol aromatic ring-opening family dioxygenase n=1 Tax=Nocardioides sp. LHD-245 TaxID=3051387 RepID=UPI0027E1034B|nr:hypothetical protein [Nocardioides sp. LHD-245]